MFKKSFKINQHLEKEEKKIYEIVKIEMHVCIEKKKYQSFENARMVNKIQIKSLDFVQIRLVWI